MIIISLTSYPARINCASEALDSLITQKTDEPYKVVLVLAEPQFPDRKLPDSITEMIQSGKIEIIWHPTDIRSHKKLIPTLKSYPDATVVITDDDVKRPDWWLQMFIDDHRKYPEDVIVGLTAWKLNDKYIQDTASHTKTKGWTYRCVTEPYKELLIERPANGLGGVLYPNHTFTRNEFFDETLFMELSPYSDESWQYCFNVIENRKLRLCGKPTDWSKYIIKNSQDTALAKHNSGSEYTRLYRTLFEKFPEYKENMASRINKYYNPEQNKTVDLLNLLKANDVKPDTPKEKEKEKNKKEETVKKETIKAEETVKPVEDIKDEVRTIIETPVIKEQGIKDDPVVINELSIKEENAQEKVSVTEEPLVPSRNTVYCRLTGRLGNNLFQIAAARFYASQHGMDVKFFFTNAYQKDKDTFEKTGLQTILKEPIIFITEEQLISDINEYHTANEQSSIIYQEIPFEENKDLILMGDRQSEKYFNKDFALGLFNLDDISKEVERLYGNLANTCAIYINKNNNILSENDVRAIRQKFPDDDFIIFSDDIEWCKSRFSDLNFRFADKTSNSYSTALIDMVAMSKCMCVVMSNSTFSWWSAYLSKRPGHITVYKKPWFTYSMNEDIIPADNSWITLEQFLNL